MECNHPIFLYQYMGLWNPLQSSAKEGFEPLRTVMARKTTQLMDLQMDCDGPHGHGPNKWWGMDLTLPVSTLVIDPQEHPCVVGG